MDKIKSTKKKVETSDETAELKSQLARALADYDNLRKRIERERDESKYLSKLIVISRFLPVFDMFEDAQKHTNDMGLGIALKVLSDTLKDEDIEEISASEGSAFDHELHEAIDTVVNAEKEDGTIAEVVLKGYRFKGGPVIRHSKVKVYKQSAN